MIFAAPIAWRRNCRPDDQYTLSRGIRAATTCWRWSVHSFINLHQMIADIALIAFYCYFPCSSGVYLDVSGHWQDMLNWLWRNDLAMRGINERISPLMRCLSFERLGILFKSDGGNKDNNALIASKNSLLLRYCSRT